MLLAAAWVAVFMPAVLRARRDTPLTSAERFRRRMEVIAPRTPAAGRWILVPAPDARRGTGTGKREFRRRTRLLIVLMVSVPATMLAALLWSGGWWEIHFATVFLLAMYVAVLLETKSRRRERLRKVSSIASRLRAEESLEAERSARA